MSTAPPSPAELLAKLAALSRRRQAGEPLRPHVVSLLLASGRDLRGTLIDLRDGVVAVETESGALGLTELKALEGVILEAPADAFRPPDDRPALSNMALREVAEELGCEVARAESADERCALADTLEQLGEALAALRSEPSVAEVLGGVSIGVGLGERALIAREEDHVQITRGRSWPDRLLAEILQDALEDVL